MLSPATKTKTTPGMKNLQEKLTKGMNLMVSVKEKMTTSMLWVLKVQKPPENKINSQEIALLRAALM